ncbi:MAG: aspartate aminotransferase family protein, partial [Fimbriimonadaceae bacterium]|nr:aspartate aminotransferase family protein [Fimbriimonadaceae bacterium]
WIIDHTGRRLLDFLGGYGVFSLGHRHPAVIEAVRNQLDRIPLSGKAFFSENQARLAARLASVSPEGLDFTFFCNSGAEAVEAALKFARAATGRAGFVSTTGGYHGKTLGALSVTPRAKYQDPFRPLLDGCRVVPFGDAEAAAGAIDVQTAAVIVEAVQGEGGIHPAPPGYLSRLRELCDQTGALLILDEVQTGLGRTGRWFGCDHEAVRPDLMTLAKALGGGVMPIGACMGGEATWKKVFGQNPLAHTSTFGGNPLACSAGLATLQVIEEEGLCERSAELGERLVKGLRGLESELIAEVRGLGLMVGVEFAMDEVGELVIGQMLKRGLVAAYTLNNPRVIRMEPPLIISEEEIDEAVSIFGEAVTETQELLAML